MWKAVGVPVLQSKEYGLDVEDEVVAGRVEDATKLVVRPAEVVLLGLVVTSVVELGASDCDVDGAVFSILEDSDVEISLVVSGGAGVDGAIVSKLDGCATSVFSGAEVVGATDS